MALTANEIKAKIGLFCTNRDALKALAQEIIIDVVHYCAPKTLGEDFGGSGRPQMILNLAKEMPKSWGVQVQDYLVAFTPIRMSVKNEKIEYTKTYAKASKEDKDGMWDIEGLNATNFFDMNEASPDDNPQALDFAALLGLVSNLAKQIDKKVEDNKVAEADVVNAKNIAETLRSIKVDRVVPDNDEGEQEDSPASETDPKVAEAA